MTARRSSAGRCRRPACSVQGVLMAAVEALCGEPVKVLGAGRTDAGVHALGQVAHVDLAKDWATDTVRDALNAHLRPHPVAVLAAEQVADTFDARFSARQRHYLYRIVNRRAGSGARARARLARRAPARCARHGGGRTAPGRPARFHHLSRRGVPGQIAGQDARSARGRALRRGGAHHGLARARSCTRRCAPWSARWCAWGWAAGRRTQLAAALDARDRSACATVAPPQGLYLVQVDY